MSTASNTLITRVFKTGATLITESPDMRGLTVEQVKQLLKSSYPEVAHATIRERTEGETLVIEFLPQVGRKG